MLMYGVWGTTALCTTAGRGGPPSFASNEGEGMRGARIEQDLGPLEAVGCMLDIIRGPVDLNSIQKPFQGKKVGFLLHGNV